MGVSEPVYDIKESDKREKREEETHLNHELKSISLAI